MGLNRKQKEAVEYLDGPLLVLAGPGTGKTQLLSSKVAYILQNIGDINPGNILCLTFTEAGASNMRERLLSIVGPEASGVHIHTYHSFGSDILAQYKNYAERFDRNLDEPIDSVMQYKIIKQILADLSPLDILKNAEIKDVISSISEAKSANLTADDLELIAKNNIENTKAMNAELSIILDEIIPRMKFEPALNIYTRVLSTIEKYVSDEKIVKWVPCEANILAESLKNTIINESKKEKPSISVLSKWRDKYFEKDQNNHYQLSNYVANKKLLSLSGVMKKYEECLAKNNLFDFTDMIQQAIKILETDDGFRYTLQERYQYILLDEYQDTNPSQASLINLLVNKNYTFIMAVGDDDQAIFEFQGASASNLSDFKNEYNAKVITLTENYRSTAEILDLSHKIADELEFSFSKLNNIEKILTSVRNDEITNGENEPFIHRHEFKSADSEYAWVAKEINQLIEAGEKQGEIAVITPKHKYIAPLLPHLKAYDKINISYEKRENVLEDRYIHELATLARFIYEISINNNPSYMLLEILTFDFFNIPAIDAISALKTTRKDTKATLDYLKDSENENLKNTAIFIANMVAKSFDTPLEQFIDEMLSESKFIEHYTKNEINFKTFNLYENLSILRERIKKHVKAEKPRLKDFIDFLDDYEAAGEIILNTSPYQDASDSIQILTAHKSKGLEFKHVFIVATDDTAWGNSKGNNNKLTLPKNLESIRHTGNTEDEKIRLFFVAITRAKKTLTMTNSKQDFSGKSPKRLEYLKEYEVNDNEVCSPLLKDPNIIEHYEDAPLVEQTDNIKNQWIASYLKTEPDFRATLEKSVENFTLFPTALTNFIDISYAGPIEFYKKYILHAPEEPADFSLEFGTLVHATFENVTNKKLSDAAAIEFFESEVKKLDIDEKEKTDMLKRGEISIRESLKAFRNILVPEDENIKARAELNLGAEHLVYNGIPITGKIDHININEKTKEIELYDFKTGNFHAEKWASHPTLYKYTLQLLFYKLLLNTSQTYKNYKITRAHILFVAPSSKDLAISELKNDVDLVHDKIYDFTATDEQDFKELLAAVYRHIKALDFIDPKSPLYVLPDKAKGIKDIYKFCDIIKTPIDKC